MTIKNLSLGLHVYKHNGVELTFYGTGLDIMAGQVKVFPEHWVKHSNSFLGAAHADGDRISDIMWTLKKLQLSRWVESDEVWTAGHEDARGNWVEADIEGRKVTVWT